MEREEFTPKDYKVQENLRIEWARVLVSNLLRGHLFIVDRGNRGDILVTASGGHFLKTEPRRGKMGPTGRVLSVRVAAVIASSVTS